MLLSSGLLVACSDPPKPPPPTNDVPPSDATDVPLVDDRLDVPVVDDRPATPDVTGDIASDTTADLPDVTPIDVPAGTAWCDLPMGPDAEVRGVTLPAGFCVRRFGRLQHPRVMGFSPTGDLFIASPGTTGPGGTGPGIDAIAVLPDDNRDGVADSVAPYARLPQLLAPGETVNPLTQTVHGLLFHNGFLYYTFQNSVNRVAFRPGDRAIPAGSTVQNVANLTGSERWTHTLAVGADGAMYVSMGIYGSFQCPYPSPERGAILRIRSAPTDTTPALNGEIVARGFRNPMYIRCQSWGCYAAELTDDGWTAPGREKIIRFEQGQDYGYPCCYDRNLPSPANGGRVNCASVTASMVGFPVGYTPFGHDFEKGNWPAPYSNGMFVGLHGQVGSWTATGIRWAPTNPTTHAFMSEESMVFMGGWGRGTPNEGRVADLAFAPDGRLFFTDDQQGQVYWIAPRSLLIPTR
jgi:glucose/arabinose dehydrogenase